jgi:hypothetical protein
MRIVFRPEYIILPSTATERVDWYSPYNRERVQIWRSYYYSIINHFGGDHSLYVDERVMRKYYNDFHEPAHTALTAFEQTLTTKYGPQKKSLFDYNHGKFPKYYMDTFADIKQKIS